MRPKLVEWEMCKRVFFFQAEDGIRAVERSRVLGDVYKGRAYYRQGDADLFSRVFYTMSCIGTVTGVIAERL